MSVKAWNYDPAGAKFKERAISIAVGAGYALALSQIFNPIALGLVGTYAAACTAVGFYIASSDKARAFMVEKALLSELRPGDLKFQSIVDEMTDKVGIAPQRAYIVNEKMVRATMPWHKRWMLRIPSKRAKIMKGVAFSLSSMNIVGSSREFLENASETEGRFAFAHEVAHAKLGDSFSLGTTVKLMRGFVQRGLLYGMALSAVTGLFGFPLAGLMAPGVGLFSGAALLIGAGIAAKLGINYVSRIVERRADRNAVYLTRDPQSAIAFLDRMTPEDKKKPWFEFKAHPSYYPRVANIQAAFAEAQDYPVAAARIRKSNWRASATVLPKRQFT